MGGCGNVEVGVLEWVCEGGDLGHGRRKLRMVGLRSWVFKHGGIMVAGFQQYED